MITTTVASESKVISQGRYQHAYVSGGKVGFELAIDGIQFYVFANLARLSYLPVSESRNHNFSESECLSLVNGSGLGTQAARARLRLDVNIVTVTVTR